MTSDFNIILVHVFLRGRLLEAAGGIRPPVLFKVNMYASVVI